MDFSCSFYHVRHGIIFIIVIHLKHLILLAGLFLFNSVLSSESSSLGVAFGLQNNHGFIGPKNSGSLLMAPCSSLQISTFSHKFTKSFAVASIFWSQNVLLRCFK